MRPPIFFWLLATSTLLVWMAAASTAQALDESTELQLQGEYSGTIKRENDEAKIGAQVIALGMGKFHAVGYPGGLPGDGWDTLTAHGWDGELSDGAVRFKGEQTHAEISGGSLRVLAKDNSLLGELKKVERKSPTLGEKPLQGAIVLFDGHTNDFSPGKVTDDGLLMAGATSKRKFQSCQLHVEFRLPFMPDKRGQARANSGCYLQGRYEVQVLDSFGLKGENNECGGIYGIKAPDINMCFPPMSWQTFDIDYTAAKYENGQKVKNAAITVKHNGVLIQKDVELPNGTTAAPAPEGPDPGPIYLQDHGNPVRYRNIWIVEKS